MSVKVALFVAEYLKDFNGTQASIRAGYAPKSANRTAYKLLKRADVKAMLAPKREEAVAERAEAMNRMELTKERTRLEIARIAYFDPRRMFKADGSMKEILELDDDAAACIGGLEIMAHYEGSGAERRLIGHLHKFKLVDKKGALDMASRILGDYEKDNSQHATYEDGLRALAAKKTADAAA